MWGTSQVSIEFSSLFVPITLQTLAVFTLPLLLTGRNASGGMLLWIILGSIGLPLFSNGASGIDVLFSNSGGFLIGFYLMTFMVRATKTQFKKGKYLKSFLLFFLFHVVLMAFGMLWIYIGNYSTITLDSHILPFVPGLLIKSALATVIIDIHLRIRFYSQINTGTSFV